MSIPQDGTWLPDDTLLSDVVLTGRAKNVCRYPEPQITTVGQLRKMTDAELMRRGNCGTMTLLELRLLTGEFKPGRPSKSDEVLKAQWVREIKHGTYKNSFENYREEQER